MPKKPPLSFGFRGLVNPNTNRNIVRANKEDRFQTRLPQRLYEADIIKRATQPVNYIPAYPSQNNPASPSPVGVNHPNIGGGSPAIPTPAGPAFTPQVADLSQNPYLGPYDDLLNYVKQSAAYRPTEYDAYAKRFAQQQELANQQMHDQYMQSRVSADQSAQALGLDPAAASANRDFMMRHSQENSDQSLADNQAWLQKLGLLAQQNTDATGNMYAAEKAGAVGKWNADEQARIAQLNLDTLNNLVSTKLAAGRSGGGGRKKGGGGGSSSSGSGTAASTDTLYNSGMDLAAYQELQQKNPALAALFKNIANSTNSSPEVKYTQKQINDLAAASTFTPQSHKPHSGMGITSLFHNAGINANNAIGSAKSKSALARKALYEAILPYFEQYSGNFGNPKSVSTTKYK